MALNFVGPGKSCHPPPDRKLGFSSNNRNSEFRRRRIDVPRGTMDGVSSLGSCTGRAPPHDQDASQIVPPHLLIPCWESQRADPEEKRGPASDISRSTTIDSLTTIDTGRPNREDPHEVRKTRNSATRITSAALADPKHWRAAPKGIVTVGRPRSAAVELVGRSVAALDHVILDLRRLCWTDLIRRRVIRLAARAQHVEILTCFRNPLACPTCSPVIAAQRIRHHAAPTTTESRPSAESYPLVAASSVPRATRHKRSWADGIPVTFVRSHDAESNPRCGGA
jgi:hypothetical protein